jgi:hypothetical protein
MGWACSTYRARRCVRRPLVRTRLGWEDDIKMDLQEVEGGGMDWLELFRIWPGGEHL